MMPPNLLPLTSRRDTLTDALLSTVDLLKRRKAADIADGYIDAYVALNWLEWHGGSLRLTTVGENQCKCLVAALNVERHGHAPETGQTGRTAA